MRIVVDPKLAKTKKTKQTDYPFPKFISMPFPHKNPKADHPNRTYADFEINPFWLSDHDRALIATIAKSSEMKGQEVAIVTKKRRDVDIRDARGYSPRRHFLDDGPDQKFHRMHFRRKLPTRLAYLNAFFQKLLCSVEDSHPNANCYPLSGAEYSFLHTRLDYRKLSPKFAISSDDITKGKILNYGKLPIFLKLIESHGIKPEFCCVSINTAKYDERTYLNIGANHTTYNADFKKTGPRFTPEFLSQFPVLTLGDDINDYPGLREQGRSDKKRDEQLAKDPYFSEQLYEEMLEWLLYHPVLLRTLTCCVQGPSDIQQSAYEHICSGISDLFAASLSTVRSFDSHKISFMSWIGSQRGNNYFQVILKNALYCTPLGHLDLADLAGYKGKDGRTQLVAEMTQAYKRLCQGLAPYAELAKKLNEMDGHTTTATVMVPSSVSVSVLALASTSSTASIVAPSVKSASDADKRDHKNLMPNRRRTLSRFHPPAATNPTGVRRNSDSDLDLDLSRLVKHDIKHDSLLVHRDSEGGSAAKEAAATEGELPNQPHRYSLSLSILVRRQRIDDLVQQADALMAGGSQSIGVQVSQTHRPAPTAGSSVSGGSSSGSDTARERDGEATATAAPTSHGGMSQAAPGSSLAQPLVPQSDTQSSLMVGQWMQRAPRTRPITPPNPNLNLNPNPNPNPNTQTPNGEAAKISTTSSACCVII